MALPFFALLPASHPLALSTYTLTLVGKILCYAIVAVALDMVWDYAGLLSLGHGLFFALGGYAMGMYLMRRAAACRRFSRFSPGANCPSFGPARSTLAGRSA
nr:amino acid ABC transporter permease [Candidatus Pantoea persica]